MEFDTASSYSPFHPFWRKASLLLLTKWVHSVQEESDFLVSGCESLYLFNLFSFFESRMWSFLAKVLNFFLHFCCIVQAKEFLEAPEAMAGLVDPELKHFNQEELETVCEVARQCLNRDPTNNNNNNNKPSVQELCETLESRISLSISAELRSSSLAWAELALDSWWEWWRRKERNECWMLTNWKPNPQLCKSIDWLQHLIYFFCSELDECVCVLTFF